ncbi:MAG: YkgJ family cysteine cluster protein [Peptococcaceae bacterium]|nr:YkgJ family cysteine cluster protein [Peptococcaceae bacterium]
MVVCRACLCYGRKGVNTFSPGVPALAEKFVHARGGPVLRIDDKFMFSCHPGLACFKKCCRDISIFLSPFDVLRLKNKLKVPSWEFLERYTIPFAAGRPGFPLVLIKMVADDLRCPFITEDGCGVYEERPWSCRMAPVEIRGAGLYGFCFDRSQCLGLQEDREQTVRQWMKEQGLEIYEKVEEFFKDIPSRIRLAGQEELDRQVMKAFHMACYDLDRFRRFIFETSFMGFYEVAEETAEKIKADDLALMQFGFAWLRSSFTDLEGLRKLDRLLKCFEYRVPGRPGFSST